MLLLSYVKVSSEWKHDCCQFLDSVRCICPTGPLDRLHAQLGSMGHEKERETLQQIVQTGFHTYTVKMESKDNHHDQRYAITEIASAATNMNLLQILFLGPQLVDAFLHPSLTQSEWISLKSNPTLHQKKQCLYRSSFPDKGVRQVLWNIQQICTRVVVTESNINLCFGIWQTVFSSYETCLFLFQLGPCQIYVYTRMCGTSCHVECWFPCEGTTQIHQICSLHSQYNLSLFVTLGYFCGKNPGSEDLQSRPAKKTQWKTHKS